MVPASTQRLPDQPNSQVDSLTGRHTHRKTGRQTRILSRDQDFSKHQTFERGAGRPHMFRKLAQHYLTWLWGLASARLHRAAAAALRSGRGPVVRMLTRGRTAPSEATAAAISRQPGQYIKAWSAPAAAACCCTLPIPTHKLKLLAQHDSTIANHSHGMFELTSTAAVSM